MADNINIVDYVDTLVRWIANDIRIPQDSSALRERIIVLRRNCEYSSDNISLLHSVEGFDRLLGVLGRDFNDNGIRNWHGIDARRETKNLCREIVKLLEILGFGSRTPYFLSGTLCGIMRMTYFEGSLRSDKDRIVRILHSMLLVHASYDLRMPLFHAYYDIIKHHLDDPLSRASELSLCADVTGRLLSRYYYDPTSTSQPLSQALRTTVSRIYEACRYEGYENEEFVEECAVLEKVMKLLCRLCAKYGFPAVLELGTNECGVMAQITKILKHALLHRRPGARSFNARHLLYALVMAKKIYESPGGHTVAAPEDVKVVLDFCMSDLPNRYLFNGRTRLKDLVDQMVPSVLDSFHAEYVLNNWNRMAGVHSNQ